MKACATEGKARPAASIRLSFLFGVALPILMWQDAAKPVL